MSCSTHPGDIPQLPEAARLGALIEITASNIYKTPAQSTAAAALVKKIGAEHMIVSTDCGQTTNVYPTDCLVLAARGLRANGVTQARARPDVQGQPCEASGPAAAR